MNLLDPLLKWYFSWWWLAFVGVTGARPEANIGETYRGTNFDETDKVCELNCG